MPDFITDPRFVIQNALAILAIVVTVALYVRQQKRKELTFDAVGISLVSPIGHEFKDKIRVLFEDEEVQEMRHFFISVEHSGNDPIKPDDYEGQLSVDFGDEARVYECEVSVKAPPGLKVAPVADGAMVRLGKPLLNPGDYFYCGVLVTTPRRTAVLDARIAGLTRVRSERDRDGVGKNWILLVGILLVVAGLYIGYVISSVPDQEFLRRPLLFAVLGGVAGAVSSLVGAVLGVRLRRR